MAPLWTLLISLSDICCSCCVVWSRNGLSTIEQRSPLFSPIAIVSWFANFLYFLLRILSVHIIVGFDCNPGVGCELLLCELVISDERKELKHEHLRFSRANFYFLCARSIFSFPSLVPEEEVFSQTASTHECMYRTSLLALLRVVWWKVMGDSQSAFGILFSRILIFWKLPE